MKKPLLLLALAPLLFVGCASDRSHDRSAAEDMNDPAYVGQTGADHIDRADTRYRVPEAGDTDRRQVRTRDDALGTSDPLTRDVIESDIDTDVPAATVPADDTVDYNDRYPDNYTPDGLNHYKKHRWSRFQY